jgi:hypothetical protein
MHLNTLELNWARPCQHACIIFTEVGSSANIQPRKYFSQWILPAVGQTIRRENNHESSSTEEVEASRRSIYSEMYPTKTKESFRGSTKLND